LTESGPYGVLHARGAKSEGSLDNISGREDWPNDGLKQAVESGVVREPDNAALLLAAAAQTSTPLFSRAATIFLGGLFVLAVFAALRDASVIILPLVLAFILNLLLQPALRVLKRLRLPAAAGSLLLIVLIIAGLVGFGTALSGPAAVWVAKLPEGIPRLVEHVRLLRGPFDALQRVLQQAEQIAAGPAQTGTTMVALQGGFAGILFGNVRAVVGGLFTTLLILFFLLIFGDTFLRHLVEILPTFHDKRRAIDISQQIERDISGYLVTITAMNTGVGVATAIAMQVTGVGDPLLWGTVAFLLNYVPILGPLTGVAIFVLAGLLTFDPLWRAILPGALYLLIHLIEGEFVTPMLMARRFTLNPVVVILSLIFWFWIWGLAGAILSVPILASTKIICDRVGPLKPLAHLLGG
jgi:predicted PurR-regulated permease PerM